MELIINLKYLLYPKLKNISLKNTVVIKKKIIHKDLQMPKSSLILHFETIRYQMPNRVWIDYVKLTHTNTITFTI